MQVLVTGSSGFVGTWLLLHLAEVGDDVVTLPDDLDIGRDDAALIELVAEAAPDAICHLAAQASVADSWTDPIASWHANTIGTVNVLRAAAGCERPPRVLLVSSAEVYGTVGPDQLPIGEDRAMAPANPYAATKAAAEMAGIAAGNGRGLHVVRARPFNHTGPGQRRDFVVPALAAQVIEAAATGAPHLLAGNLSAKRDLLDVRDVVAAYRLLVEHGCAGAAYNVCSGRSVRIEDVARALMAAEGIDLPIEVDPARLRPSDIPELRGDPSRLAADTGWVARIPLDQTLRDVLDSLPRPV